MRRDGRCWNDHFTLLATAGVDWRSPILCDDWCGTQGTIEGDRGELIRPYHKHEKTNKIHNDREEPVGYRNSSKATTKDYGDRGEVLRYRHPRKQKARAIVLMDTSASAMNTLI